MLMERKQMQQLDQAVLLAHIVHWKISRKMEPLTLVCFLIKIRLAMWMKMENIKAMMYTLQIVWQKI